MSVFSSIVEGVVPIEDLHKQREEVEGTVDVGSKYITNITPCIFSDSFSRFSGKCGLDKLEDNLPYISVTGYYQSTLIQKFTNLLDYFQMGESAAEGSPTTATKRSANDTATKWQELRVGLLTAKGWEALLSPIANSVNFGKDNFIEKVPYVLLLSLMKTEKFANFRLPISGEFELMGSDSGYGWTQPTAMAVGTQGNSFSGTMASMVGLGGVLRSLGVFLSPVFTAGTGTGENPSMTINIDLINDMKDKAIKNTNFLKSLTVKNMWMQYGVWQLPGALYDVVVGKPGENTYLRAQFMCTANFKVTPKGAFRKCAGIDFPVPEAYNFVATFKSLLPNNLNTHLFAQYEQAFKNREGVGLGTLTSGFEDARQVGRVIMTAQKELDVANQELTELKDELTATEKAINDSPDGSTELSDMQEHRDLINSKIVSAEKKVENAKRKLESAKR